jgi:hypothetical protein
MSDIPDSSYEAADEVVDLRGLNRAAVLARLELVLALPRQEGLRVAVLIDPARPGAGETHFQPVGRRIVEARRQGLVRAAQPIPPGEDAGGFVIEVAGGGSGADRPS